MFADDVQGDPLNFTMLNTGGGGFAIFPNGTLYVNVSHGWLDYEARDLYTVTLMVMETYTAHGPLLFSNHTFDIEILDVNEAPYFSLVPSTLTITALSCPGTVVGTAPLSLSVYDEDFGNNSLLAVSTLPANYQFDVLDSNGANCTGAFPCYLVLRADAATIPYGVNNNRMPVQLTVKDSGNGLASPPLSLSLRVLMPSSPPSVSTDTKYICENSEVDSEVFNGTLFQAGLPPLGTYANSTGSPVFATSDSCPYNLSFSLTNLNTSSNVLNATFGIDAETGIIFLATGSLDYEVQNLYTVMVNVTHGLGMASVVLNISIVNVDEPMSISVPSQVEPNANLAVGTVVSSAITIVCEDFKDIPLAVTGGNGYFGLSPNVSTNVNGTRAPISLVVIAPGLPNSVLQLNIIGTDTFWSPFTKQSNAIICIVRDVNLPPKLTYHYGSSQPMDPFPENPLVDAVVGIVNASDPNLYQNLTFTVVGTLTSFFYLQPILTPWPFPVGPEGNWLRANRQPIHSWAAYLYAYGGAPIDFEAMQALGGSYDVAISVTDEPILLLNSQYQLSTEGDLPITIAGDTMVPVANVPDVPVVTGIITQSPFGLTTAGGEEIVLQGINFGNVNPPHPSLASQFASGMINAIYSNGITKFVASSCAVSVSYVQIRCRSSTGFGTGYGWVVSTDYFMGQYSLWQYVQNSSISNNTINYAPPSVSGFTAPHTEAGNPATAALTSGDQVIIVEGSQFGTVDANAVNGVTYGPSGVEYVARECNVTKDHAEITCITSPGVGSALRWVVNIDGQLSQTPTTSYAPPNITGVVVLPANASWQPYDASLRSSLASTEGGQQVIIRGTNFGPVNERVRNTIWGVLLFELEKAALRLLLLHGVCLHVCHVHHLFAALSRSCAWQGCHFISFDCVVIIVCRRLKLTR